ncbi:efflux RND transporter periplasmic adaptor subunit [Chitinophaga rhizophila]|uniref:Efflux RND transporter periplasmic adaptor subunit n=1 Tax=Chitinophaga rhizophila TaxID=2866212 RepID=A0ABS7GGR1_9BACT|nr:efflux RND transporter periplasmic adaptor subunit [Chitinophaga rhizophila]MBW8686873.1 efflux RND transporter periplasmic adaptor subunit [Chitinophaga rhizophila]
MYKYLFIIALSGVMITACHESKPKQKPAVKDSKGRKYQLTTVVREPLSSTIQLPAVLEAYQKVSIYPRVNGFVKTVNVDRGSAVRRGQVLITLEAPEIIQQYFAAQSKYLQSKAVFAASKDNYERTLAVSETPGTISAHDVEVANARMEADSAIMNSELANFRALEATRSYLTVTAPFDGVITERNIHPGALVGPGARMEPGAMLMLEQEDRLRLVVQVPEVYSAQLSATRQVSFHVNALPGKVFTGNISRQAGSLSNRYRSEAVEVDVTNNQHLLKPGMYAEISVPVTGSVQAMVVPSSAIVTSTEKKYVVAVRDGQTRWIDVQEGNHHSDSTEIFGKLLPDEKVIANANDEIKEGMRIDQEG